MVREIKLPPLLKEIPDPPKRLYLLGNEEILHAEKIIAIVGTRQITDYGKEITTELTKGLVRAGYIIVSGLALGIDGVAHEIAIDSGGKTVAVLGAGVDIIYPPIHRDLYNSILASGGAIISEVAPGRTVSRAMFPARNRIMSGLSRAVLVTQASIRSGSLITARQALDQGRDVFAVSGSEGTDYLIDQGAKRVLKVEDIIEEMV